MRRACTFFLLLFLSACDAPFTRENFNLIQVGVDERADVVKLIGQPRSSYADAEEWYYEDDAQHAAALIHFSPRGKVSGKQWLEGDDNPLVGGNPHAAPRDGIKSDIRNVLGLD